MKAGEKIMKFCFRHSLRCLCGNQVETGLALQVCCAQERGLGHRDITQGHQHKDDT